MKLIPLSELRRRFSSYLHLAEDEEIIITRHGKPAGVLIGFKSEDDWFDYRLENDPATPGTTGTNLNPVFSCGNPAFQKRITAARDDLRAGRGVRLEELPE